MATVTVLANNGPIAGGEVMALQTAHALRELGHAVTVVGPGAEGGVVEVARSRGFAGVDLSADRAAYIRDLARWAWNRRDDLHWAHGLVPGLATAGMAHRIVHLHQQPDGLHRAATVAARFRAMATIVPSQSMARVVHGAAVLPNWTADCPIAATARPDAGAPLRIGFLGRTSVIKGSVVLHDALRVLDQRAPGRYRLICAGESRFVGQEAEDRVRESVRGLEHAIAYLGWVEPMELFARADIVVVPSLCPESFGLVAAEAMSARRPVIVSDAGGLPEVVGQDYPWITKAGDAAALADLLERLASAPPADLTQVVERSRQRWEQEFSPDAGRQRVADLLAGLGITA